MLTSIQSLNIAIAALLSVVFLASCGPKNNNSAQTEPAVQPVDRPVGSPNSGGETSPAITTPRAAGTSDSGGGTGVDNKVFESYIVNPISLPAYKNILTPLLANIKTANNVNLNIAVLFSLKTWYLAPVDLAKVDKDSLGLSFIETKTQQFARQSKKEIWMDKKAFDKMNEKDQADLILHELVMSMYFIKFMSLAEICKIYVGVDDKSTNESCEKGGGAYDQIAPPEMPRALTDTDNENIRYVTGWLLQNLQRPVSERSFVEVLASRDFDKRFFSPRALMDEAQRKESLKPIKMSTKGFVNLIKGSVLSGDMPNVCNGKTTKESVPCKVDIQESPIQYGKYEIPGHKLQVTMDGKNAIEMPMLLGAEIELSASEVGQSDIVYIAIIADIRNQIKVGDRFYSGYIVFNKSSSPMNQGLDSLLVLDSIVLIPGVITSIDKTQTPICKGKKLTASGFADDSYSIRRPNTKPNMIELIYSDAIVGAVCSADNVAD